jgi:hypothetical protein
MEFPAALLALLAAAALLSGCGGGGSSAPSGPQPPAVCHATSAATLLMCASTAANGSLDQISIDGPISCSGANACAMVIDGVTRPLVIAGNGQTIQRLDASDYAFLVISNSSHITVINLVLADAANVVDYALPTAANTSTNTACHPASGATCAPTVYVAHSDSVTLDHLTVEHAKNLAVSLDSGSNLQVTACTFSDAFLTGVSIGAAATQVTIANSVFEDIRSNALVISGTQVTVSGSTFHHDHHAAAWWDSPNTRRPSSGGIVFIYNHSHNVVFQGNEILGAQIDEQIDPALASTQFGLQAHGVEIDYAADLGQTSDLSDIQILDNRIHDLSGVAITLPLEYVHDASVNISISGNTFYNDFVDPTTGAPVRAPIRSTNYSGPLTYPFDQNCYAQTCPAAQPPAPNLPHSPAVSSSATACTNGYGATITGTFGEQVYVDVDDAVSGAFLQTYMGTGGPYEIDHRTITANSDGTHTVSFCYATAAEKAAFDGTGVNAFLVDPYTYLNSGPIPLKR